MRENSSSYGREREGRLERGERRERGGQEGGIEKTVGIQEDEVGGESLRPAWAT